MKRPNTYNYSNEKLIGNKSRFYRFIWREIMDFRHYGIRVFPRKITTFLFLILPAALALPVVLLIRALRPIMLIRFGELRPNRIGHFTANVEIYMCDRDAGVFGKRTLDIFYYPLHIAVCNRQLKRMWNRILRISFIAHILGMSNRWLPGNKVHTVPIHEQCDSHNLLIHTRPHLSFTPEEEARGVGELKRLGIPEGAPFVCIHARSASYLNTTASKVGGNWDYHDFRNANIHNYIQAADELTRRGYYVIRIGAVVKKALKVNNPKIIDYATKYRNDFFDIFLLGKCRFLLGSSAGINSVSRIFRVPVAYANFLPLYSLFHCVPYGLVIPKKMWLKRERRFLTFPEIFDLGIQEFDKSSEYGKLGIQTVENTPEEIFDLAIEIDKRLRGVWQAREEDQELQSRFWSLFRTDRKNEYTEPSEFRGKIPGVWIGAEFLRQNRRLLE